MEHSNELDVVQDLPDDFALSIVMQRRTSSSPWADYEWSVTGVVAQQTGESASGEPQRISEQGEVARFHLNGFRLRLYADECESYYHNLMSERPRCFVIADNDDDMPRPVRVSLSMDEAHAYLEGEQEVYAVDLPAELYRWCEAFVLNHYVPQKKFKRKLTNWSGEPKEGSAS